ncbi:MAG: chemotaxis protein CheD, partial [Bacteroidales bacterium]|nr:chemotaxis protein CheD [Bacteroidales bacterium]
ARVFGGAEVLTGTPTNFHIGRRNARIAIEILTEFKIPILLSDVGGNRGRKINFNTLTGEVEHEFIRHRERILDVGTAENKNQTGNFFKRIGAF